MAASRGGRHAHAHFRNIFVPKAETSRAQIPNSKAIKNKRRSGPRARQAPGAIERAAATSRSGAACEAARGAFDGGRVPDDASCDVPARRVVAGEHVGDGAGPAACDRLAREGARLRVA